MREWGKTEKPNRSVPEVLESKLLEKKTNHILRVPYWKEAFELVSEKFDLIFDRDLKPTTLQDFPIIRRITLRLKSPFVVLLTETRAPGSLEDGIRYSLAAQ